MAKKYFNISEISFQPKPTTQPNFQDFEGRTFKRLTVLGYAGRRQHLSWWYCLRKDGAIICVSSRYFPKTARRNCTQSSGEYRNGKESVEARTYHHARTRCCNPNDKAFPCYGGRGIEFRFTSFKEFIDEVGRRPSSKHTLDRIDSNGHYEKGNVRWATMKEQQNNRRNNVLLTFDGETHTIAEWAEKTGIPYQNLYIKVKKLREKDFKNAGKILWKKE